MIFYGRFEKKLLKISYELDLCPKKYEKNGKLNFREQI